MAMATAPVYLSIALLRRVHAFAWGSVPPAPWLALNCFSHRPSPSTFTSTLKMEVVVDRHGVLHQGTIIYREAGRAAVQFDVSDRDLVNTSAGAEAVIEMRLCDAVRSLSYVIREYDPRIGTTVPIGQVRDLLPRTPMFDPPRLRPPAWKGGASLDAATCPFCQDEFGAGYPAMWGGGNLLWVHPSCWLRAHE